MKLAGAPDMVRRVSYFVDTEIDPFESPELTRQG